MIKFVNVSLQIFEDPHMSCLNHCFGNHYIEYVSKYKTIVNWILSRPEWPT